MSLSSLAQTHAAAQAQALAFHGITTLPVPGPAPTRRRRWLAATLITTLLAITAAAVSLQHRPVMAAVADTPVPDGHPGRLWETSEHDPATTPSAAPGTPPPAHAAASATHGTLEVSFSHRSVRIESRAASRWDAARQLAELTGTQLLGQPDALLQAPPLSMTWKGRDLRAAWSVLLGNDVNHALQCDAAAGPCRVWVLGPPAVAAADAAAPRSEPPVAS